MRKDSETLSREKRGDVCSILATGCTLRPGATTSHFVVLLAGLWLQAEWPRSKDEHASNLGAPMVS